MMKLSDKLIALRKENGWSQEDFAEKVDVSRQAISRWENGTALPDAQNLLRISKLFNVSADYLLNDDYEDEIGPPAGEKIEEKAKSSVRKKKHWYLIPITCLIVISGCAVMQVVKSMNEVHTHPQLSRVIENKVAPSCTVEGSYDEVLYCAECGAEVLRTHIIEGMPSHQFQNEKCIICGEEQRARD
jgi:transcriptional regulator with XRE-family HTH domain